VARVRKAQCMNFRLELDVMATADIPTLEPGNRVGIEPTDAPRPGMLGEYIGASR